jgi:hypothetical protein
MKTNRLLLLRGVKKRLAIINWIITVGKEDGRAYSELKRMDYNLHL